MTNDLLICLFCQGSLEEGFEKEHTTPLLIEGTAPFNTANASRDAFRRVFAANRVQLTRNIEFQSRSGTKPEAVNTTFGEWVDTLSEENSIPFVFEFCNGALCNQIESSFGIPEYLKKSCMILYINAGKASNGVSFPPALADLGPFACREEDLVCVRTRPTFPFDHTAMQMKSNWRKLAFKSVSKTRAK